jgi:hypothetical protein
MEPRKGLVLLIAAGVGCVGNVDDDSLELRRHRNLQDLATGDFPVPPDMRSPAIVVAASANFSDVSAAVASAAAGGTVQIPAGAGTWSQSLHLDKAITLAGSGSDVTVLTRATGFGAPFIAIGPSTDVPIRVSGIGFENVVRADWGITGGSPAPGDRMGIGVFGTRDGSYSLTKIRIDHCRFHMGQRQVGWYGWSYGLVDHNTFVDGSVDVYVSADDDLSWRRPILPGTANAVFLGSRLVLEGAGCDDLYDLSANLKLRRPDLSDA